MHRWHAGWPITETVTVYLLSKLPEEVVSSLGFAFVGDSHEIVRLASHHKSCILLPNAQYAWPTAESEE